MTTLLRDQLPAAQTLRGQLSSGQLDTITDPGRRHVWLFLFDCEFGNPNGDPKRPNNLPRQDMRSKRGYITDGAQKRWLRDTAGKLVEGLGKAEEEEARYDIFIRSRGMPLNAVLRQVDEGLHGGTEMGEDGGGGVATLAKPKVRRDQDEMRARRNAIVGRFWDQRMFGGVNGTGDFPAESVRGPVQIVAATSVHPIDIWDNQISRVVATTEADAKAGKATEFGHKAIIPYGLYWSKGFYNAPLGTSIESGGTGVTSDDLLLFWVAMQEQFELTRSAAKGYMSFRRLFIWSHESQYGNMPSHKLFERVQVVLNEGVTSPRAFADYSIAVNQDDLPNSVTLTVIA